MPRAQRFDYHTYDDGDVVLYQRAGTRCWQAKLKLKDGTAVNPVSTKQADLDKALKWAREQKIRYEVLIEQGQDPTAATFQKIVQRWLKSIEDADARKVADYTLIANRYHIPFFGKYRITEISQQVLAEYERWRKVFWTSGPGSKLDKETITRKDGKVYTRTKKLGSADKAYNEDTVLRLIFKYAVAHDLLAASKMPQIGSKRPKSAKITKANRYPAFTKDQFEKILAHTANTGRPPKSAAHAELGLIETDEDRLVFDMFINLVLGTGMRPGKEHVLVRWKHIREEQVSGQRHGFLTIAPETKTGRREVRIDTFAYAKLLGFQLVSAFKGDDDFVLADQTTGLPVKSFKRQFDTMCRNLKMTEDAHGKKFVPYSLRHTYATLKLEEGVDIRLVAMNMGNSPEVVHAHYGHDSTVNRANELATDLDWTGMQKPKAKDRKRPPPPEPV